MPRKIRERVVENTPSNVPSSKARARPAATTLRVTPKPSQNGPIFSNVSAQRRGSSSPSSIYTNPHFSISASSQPLAAQARTHSSTTTDRSLPFLVATP